jgi:hypothetical protein
MSAATVENRREREIRLRSGPLWLSLRCYYSFRAPGAGSKEYPWAGMG